MPKTDVRYLSISSEYAGQRIDNYLVTYLKGVPKTHIYRILRKGEVRVNKKRVAPSYRLQENDIVRLPPLQLEADAPIAAPSASFLAFLRTRILHEDDHLLIINKPAGISVHGGSGVKLGLVEALRHLYPKHPLELAHRLDVDTSGCLILAKKRSALREIHALMREGQVRKIYWTLTQGHWKDSELRAEAALRKNILTSGERIVKVDPEGKPSITQFRPLKKYKGAMLVEALLETGRTHQIRVHARHQGHPVAGDEKYGNKLFNKTMRELGLKRLFLHAYEISFTLPMLEKTFHIQAPLEPDLEACLKALELTSSSA